MQPRRLLRRRLLRRGRPRVQPRAEVPDHAGQDRDDDDRQHDQREVLLDERVPAEEVAGERARPHPQAPARNIERQEPAIGHPPQPGDERRERADDRHEPRHDDRLRPVALEERVRALDVLLLHEPRLLRLEDPRAEELADEVVAVVPHHRRTPQQAEQQRLVQRARPRQRPGRKQQRIAGQERRHDQARLAEDDHEQDEVGPRPVLLHQLEQAGVEVEDELGDEVPELPCGNPEWLGPARGPGLASGVRTGRRRRRPSPNSARLARRPVPLQSEAP